MEPADSVDVTYRSALTEADVSNLWSYEREHGLRHLRFVLNAVVVLAVLAPLATLYVLSRYTTHFYDFDQLALGWGITTVTVPIILTVLNNTIVGIACRRKRREATQLMSKYEFGIGRAAITVITPFGKEVVPWTSIREIDENRGLVFVWIDSALFYFARSDAMPMPVGTGSLFEVATRYWKHACVAARS